MNITVKKIIIWAGKILRIGIIAFLSYVAYIVYAFITGCSMDDGPFKAVSTTPIEITETSERFKLSKGGELILTNRKNTLSPILTLIENGKIKWALDTDVKNTKGYENCRIWEISNLKVTKDTNPIKISFKGHWTYGAEAGSMEIDRENGENCFCLSW